LNPVRFAAFPASQLVSSRQNSLAAMRMDEGLRTQLAL
jgi:hypothetical protein